MTQKKLWRLEIDFGRMGKISSTFFATAEQMEDLRTRSIWLDDVLGKHSEITIDFSDLTEQELSEVEGLSETTLMEMNKILGDLVGGWLYPWDYTEQWEEY